MLLQAIALPDRVTGQSTSSGPSLTSLVKAQQWDFARLRLLVRQRWCVSFKDLSDDFEGLFGVLQGYDLRGMLAMDRENGLWEVLAVSEFTFGLRGDGQTRNTGRGEPSVACIGGLSKSPSRLSHL